MFGRVSVLSLACVLSLCSSGVCLGDAESARAKAESGFAERWEDFRGDERSFPLWTPGWNEQELQARFDQITKERWSVYFVHGDEWQKEGAGPRRSLYSVPESWQQCGSRVSYPCVFSYNMAVPFYNASIITLDGMQFLAMEAPSQETLKAFCSMLTQFEVTDLVRLTAARSGTREDSFPYWEGNLNIHPKTTRPTVELGGREIHYVCTDRWENHEGIEPERLIALVKAVLSHGQTNQMIGVHCRAGVGRTGAFLAACALIRDIDKQLAQGVPAERVQVSVDKVVWKLSLQRAFMIARFSQYITLYRLVGAYLSMR